MTKQKRKIVFRRIIFLLAMLIGLCYVLVTSSLIGKAISIVAAADSGLLPSIAIANISAGVLAWIADRLCRVKL